MDDLFSRVSELLASRFEVEQADLRSDASFDDMGLDSLAQVELGEILAQEFGVDIDDEEMENMSTLTELVGALRQKGVAV
ncbi:acyl carrier protein [Saccharopolyspora erythraea NRRL 2338]|uniref:Acyl carrier protein n=2 Tax=Saccharopolyspora erythraea TaxID=1836 RepID=A4FL00_SACEN|nr:phosphopantetheine-binding protein [Saccharopolyspora erythraea]EQD84133.1 acyl carrier protein [Saccharopolyspora erythraea D]PFG98364.1 acyl carrier protein [Saccharopolyspora erythraea NRRL 2338]QRK88436.1 acyl carrier protein [Saccharopolyspora erythraea]CAM04725.1 probable acyl carrier protein [Saccharopolyspora erythraea NRRL 2338]